MIFNNDCPNLSALCRRQESAVSSSFARHIASPNDFGFLLMHRGMNFYVWLLHFKSHRYSESDMLEKVKAIGDLDG